MTALWCRVSGINDLSMCTVPSYSIIVLAKKLLERSFFAMVDCTNILSLLKINSESLKCDPEIVTSDGGWFTVFCYNGTKPNALEHWPAI